MKLNKSNVTYLPEKKGIEKKWWLIDASDLVLGRLATKISEILRGKDHPYYTPFFDCGDFVIVINAKKVKLTGSKEEQKLYYRHSGYRGGIKEISYQRMLATHPGSGDPACGQGHAAQEQAELQAADQAESVSRRQARSCRPEA